MVKRKCGYFILIFVLGLLINSASRAEFVVNVFLFQSIEAADSLEQMKNPDMALSMT